MNVLAVLLTFQVMSCQNSNMNSVLAVGAKGCALYSGSASDKWDVAVVGDGFTESCADTQLFHEALRYSIDIIEKTSPFELCAFNIYWVRLISNDSGADHPLDVPPTCQDTPLNSQFGNPDVVGGGLITVAEYADRILFTPTVWRCFDAADLAGAGDRPVDWDLVIVIVNDRAYGGRAYPESNPPLVMVSRGCAIDQVLPHEMAHIVGSLGDEYDVGRSESECASLGEPEEPNLTSKIAPPLKWSVADGVPIPTTPNSLEALAQSQNVSLEELLAKTVGLWEGANQCKTGFYRPQYRCLMRSNYQPFCAVCYREILWKMASACAKTPEIQTPFDYDFRPSCVPGVAIRFPLPPCPKCLLAVASTPNPAIDFVEDDKMTLRLGPLPPDSELRIVDASNTLVETMQPAAPGNANPGGDIVMFRAEWRIEFGKQYFVEFVPKKCPVVIRGDFSTELYVNGRRVSWPPDLGG